MIKLQLRPGPFMMQPKHWREFDMTREGICLERNGKVAMVTIHRPQRRNAFNSHMFSELGKITGELKKNLPL